MTATSATPTRRATLDFTLRQRGYALATYDETAETSDASAHSCRLAYFALPTERARVVPEQVIHAAAFRDILDHVRGLPRVSGTHHDGILAPSGIAFDVRDRDDFMRVYHDLSSGAGRVGPNSRIDLRGLPLDVATVATIAEDLADRTYLTDLADVRLTAAPAVFDALRAELFADLRELRAKLPLGIAIPAEDGRPIGGVQTIFGMVNLVPVKDAPPDIALVLTGASRLERLLQRERQYLIVGIGAPR
jgi:hypothetical protein